METAVVLFPGIIPYPHRFPCYLDNSDGLSWWGFAFGASMNTLTETEKAYLAGLVDGEGCIHINKHILKNSPSPSYAIQLVISQSDGPFLKYWIDKVGMGSLHCRNRETVSKGLKEQYRNNFRDVYAWHMTSHQASEFIRAIRPYLVLKCKQADIALELQSTMDIHRKSGRKGNRLPASILARREQLHQSIMDKNQRKDEVLTIPLSDGEGSEPEQLPMF